MLITLLLLSSASVGKIFFQITFIKSFVSNLTVKFYIAYHIKEPSHIIGTASPGWPFETARFPAGGFCK